MIGMVTCEEAVQRLFDGAGRRGMADEPLDLLHRGRGGERHRFEFICGYGDAAVDATE